MSTNSSNLPNPPDKAGLEKAADFVNYLLALGTGALVFSAELIKKDYPMSSVARDFVLFSWFLLAISVLGGIIAYMRIPVMLSEKNYDLEDRYMIRPGRVQQLSFLIGIPALGMSLGILLWNRDLNAVQQAKPAQATSQEAVSGHFVIANSGLVTGGGGKEHSHTFLLNDKTGEAWQMRCSKDGAVEFRRITIEGLYPKR
jgi:hypothetical protein